MSTFPVIDSTISAKHLGLFIQEKYGLGPELHCKLFRTGINHSYIVRGQNEMFIFRVYSFDWRSKLEISEEIRLLLLLKEHNISISYPIEDINGTYIQKVQAPEGERYAVLFSYAKGVKVRNFSKATSFDIGSLMGRMHKVTENQHLERIDYNAISLTSLPYQYAKKIFPESSEEMCFVKQAGEIITDIFNKADRGKLRKGAVHLDMWYDNMHINDGSDLTIFDFDFCGNGWLLHDVAYFIMQLFHTETNKQEYELKLKAFFEGYETVTKIPEEEKRLLHYSGLSIWIFYLGVQSQRFDNWSNIFLTENYLKRYIGMVKEWLSYNQIDLFTDQPLPPTG